MHIQSNSNPFAMLGAQKPAQASGAASFFGSTAPAGTQSAARKEFDDLVKKTPAQQMRDQILKSLGLDEDKVKAMKPEERAALEAKIKDIIKTKIEEAQKEKGEVAPGQVVDIKA
jgi:hypothetical protein